MTYTIVASLGGYSTRTCFYSAQSAAAYASIMRQQGYNCYTIIGNHATYVGE